MHQNYFFEFSNSSLALASLAPVPAGPGRAGNALYLLLFLLYTLHDTWLSSASHATPRQEIIAAILSLLFVCSFNASSFFNRRLI